MLIVSLWALRNLLGTIYDDEYIVLDAQKVPTNVLDSMAKRLVKVNRHIQKAFKSE